MTAPILTEIQLKIIRSSVNLFSPLKSYWVDFGAADHESEVKILKFDHNWWM